MEKIIRKVWLNKSTNQRMVSLPLDCNVKEGDYVEIIKVI
jgi:hypothetical protein